MCGIYAVINDVDAGYTVFDGLKKLEYRGYDSWGVAIEKNGVIVMERKTGKIGTSKLHLPKSTIGFGHTRWATHGGVTVANAHPHVDCTNTIAVVHNGIIENYSELKEQLKGHIFRSETDTEVFAHLVESLCESHTFVDAVRLAFKQLKGLNAMIVFHAGRHELVAIKRGSPLILGLGKKQTWIASDAASLTPHTKRVVFLEDDEMAVVREDSAELYALSGKKKTMHPVTLNFSYQSAERGTYPHFNIKEIHEQPRVLQTILDEFSEHTKPLERLLTKEKSPLFIGCGGGSYAALASAYLYSQFTGKPAASMQGNETPYLASSIDRNMVPIFISQSGETIDLVQTAHLFQKQGRKIGVMTNVLGSTLYRIADAKVLLGAGPEIAVVSTKAMTAMIATGLCLAVNIGKKQAEGKHALHKAIFSIGQILEPLYIKQHIVPLAQRLQRKRDVFVIGRKIAYPTALEAALKLKEIAYMRAEAFAGGELKHGMIALVQKGSPCLVFAPEDETYSEIISNAMEVKARGGYIIGASSKSSDVFDIYLPVNDANEAAILPQIVVAQLLAYHLAVLRGNDPDKPRNLAKSVVVK